MPETECHGAAKRPSGGEVGKVGKFVPGCRVVAPVSVGDTPELDRLGY